MKTEKEKRIIKLTAVTLAAVIAAAVMGFLFYRFKIGFPCVFNSVTRLKCPGCGNTHAVISLYRFRIREALTYNYLFPVEFFYILWVYFFSARSYIKHGRFNYSSPFKPLDIAVLAAIIIWFIVRNIFHI